MMAQCTACQQSFNEAELEYSENGLICGVCAADKFAQQAGSTSLLRSRNMLGATFTATLLSSAISVRSTQTTSNFGAALGIPSQTTVSISADLPGLIFGGVGLLLGLVGLLFTITAKPDDLSEESMRAHKKKQLIFCALLALVTLWAGFELYDALPRTYTTSP